MNAQRFQQVRTDVRRTIGRHTLALGLGLSMPVAQGWPGATLMGSAYDGQTSYPMRLAPAAQQGWPGATLTGSAYDGR